MAENEEKGQVMKIRTITCHDVYNVGASLQAYALQTYLKSLGHDVKIIDYKPDYLSKHYRLDVVGNPKYDKPFVREAYLLAKLPERLHALPRKKTFDSFTAKHLDLTRRYTSNEELQADPPRRMFFSRGAIRYGIRCSRTGKTLPSIWILRCMAFAHPTRPALLWTSSRRNCIM